MAQIIGNPQQRARSAGLAIVSGAFIRPDRRRSPETPAPCRNAHGRGLNLKPIVDQVESFDLVGPRRGAHVHSRYTRISSGWRSAVTGCSGYARAPAAPG
jgi:hypothetical protein